MEYQTEFCIETTSKSCVNECMQSQINQAFEHSSIQAFKHSSLQFSQESLNPFEPTYRCFINLFESSNLLSSASHVRAATGSSHLASRILISSVSYL
ncbi:hypothetical protein EYC80_000451 [Monilinia laxa]|uniref:Uncharacterized protein n=1 Tax=Monilinia laxa TaxID=61186 RepID=A0A5N6KAM6_MONLA|nr:hypothetical protein EYC80_000451 [Monilinia laxa]